MRKVFHTVFTLVMVSFFVLQPVLNRSIVFASDATDTNTPPFVPIVEASPRYVQDVPVVPIVTSSSVSEPAISNEIAPTFIISDTVIVPENTTAIVGNMYFAAEVVTDTQNVVSSSSSKKTSSILADYLAAPAAVRPSLPRTYSTQPPPCSQQQPDMFSGKMERFQPGVPTDEYFVVDTGGHLDNYLFREDLPNGQYTFSIPITRFYTDLVDEQGFLKRDENDNIIAVEKGLLPSQAALTLTVFDVDHEDATCAEVDYIFINGVQLKEHDGSFAQLTSGHGKTSLLSFIVPIEMLKFPQRLGDKLGWSCPTPAENTIAIEVNHNNCGDRKGWAVEVDWAELYIPSPLRPIVFAHGWTDSKAAWTNQYKKGDYEKFEEFMKKDSILYREAANLGACSKVINPKYNLPYCGLGSIAEAASDLKQEIYRTLVQFGVDKVNLFAHSKGGLVSRYALRTESDTVENLVTFGTPHHGADAWWQEVGGGLNKCSWEFGVLPWINTDYRNCVLASEELKPSRIRDEFNYDDCRCTLITRIGEIPLPSNSRSCLTGWKGCTLKRNAQSPDVNYYSIAEGDKQLLDTPISFAKTLYSIIVPSTSATYPWLANTRPYPTQPCVDAIFSYLTHRTVKEHINSYKCAMSLIDGKEGNECPTDGATSGCVGGGGWQYNNMEQPNATGQSANTAATTTASDAGTYQTISLKQGDLAATSEQTITATVDGSDTIFTVLSSVPMSFTLTTPTGQVINPETVANDSSLHYDAQPDPEIEGGWQYQYGVEEPIAGTWQSTLKTNDLARFVFMAVTTSTIQLVSQVEHYTYRPGGTVKVQALLLDSETPIQGVTLTGKLVQSNITTTLELAFYDDGTNGDDKANDGIYTAQFEAPSENGLYSLELQATKGNIVRLSSNTIIVAQQSAQVHQVAEVALDKNKNGLYDSLQMNIALDVLQEGHFSVNGTLMSMDGKTITSAMSSTMATNSYLH